MDGLNNSLDNSGCMPDMISSSGCIHGSCNLLFNYVEVMVDGSMVDGMMVYNWAH